jgi:hypothetical protein
MGTIFLIGVFWAAVGGVVGVAIGKGKGRGGAGFWLGLFFGPIGWIVVAVMQPTLDPEVERAARASAVRDVERIAKASALRVVAEVTPNEDASDTRICPYCAETIKSAAIKCRYCGSAIEPVASSKPELAAEPSRISTPNRNLESAAYPYKMEQIDRKRRRE